MHGGAGHVEDTDGEQQHGAEHAASAGWAKLVAGESALEAVVTAVCLLEDDPHFNAGRGAVLNLAGATELDAAVATGEGGFGAVGALQAVQHPVLVARDVMEQTDHLLLVGEGALAFARARGYPPFNPVTVERLQRYERDRALLEQGTLPYWQRLNQRRSRYGTVGAVAVDRAGAVAAATSTGGISLKLPGRVGDTPVMGAGTYAELIGAASATGDGEGILRLGLTRLAVQTMVQHPAQQAVEAAIEVARQKKVAAGLIAVDAQGGLGFACTTPQMVYACLDEKGLRSGI
ncbi:MAG: isoaspartyl peptidase/L-asparaginase [Firmicutes bacterium]|nr:isoaspartyl peptidase/L-asparaginase [Bacillota bacterium]